jgi:ankyrin repeat protein
MDLISICSRGVLADVKAAVESGDGGAVDINCRDSAGRTALLEAAWNGSADIAEYLLERGADPNAADRGGFTPLMRAVEGGHLPIAAALLARGADVGSRGNVRKTTALMLAAENGRLELIARLLDGGALINDTDQYEETALSLAQKAGREEAARLLESKGGRGKIERSAYYAHGDRDASSVTVEALPQWSAASHDAMGVGRGTARDFDD